MALGGSGSASFDLGQIGPAAQYQGFGNYTKTGNGTWILTGATSDDDELDGCVGRA